MATRFKNKRSIVVTLGISAVEGSDAYNTTNGGLIAGGSEITVAALMPGDFSVSKPGRTSVDPLVRGVIPSDGAPLCIDDQAMNGSFPLYKRLSTSALVNLIQDVFHQTGFFATEVTANNVESTVESSDFFHFCLKAVFTNPADATDTFFEIYRQAWIVSIEDAVGDPNTQTITWTCRRAQLTDNDIG